MVNIEEILKTNNVTVTDEQKAAIVKAVKENYKTISEFDKKVEKLETERDGYKEQFETATETLKGFDGIKPEELQAEVAKYKKAAEEKEKEFKQELEKRDFSDALEKAIGDYKFSSEYAKKSVMEEIKGAGLKLVDGKIIGLNDMMETIKGKDASAFVDEKQQKLEQSRAKFTKPAGQSKDGTKISMSELMKMKNENPDMDISQYME
ncbi:MAG: phage scaffolding protein [Agathobacter sp.]|nr:phage scaffolding protein [Clostridium sp.]MDY5521578.1 phage scaffolding protein [Agathobacter sp.]